MSTKNFIFFCQITQINKLEKLTKSWVLVLMENGFAHSIYKIKNQKNSSPKTSIFDIKAVDPIDPTNPSDPFDLVDIMCPFDFIRFA